jgi:hypothetical protein
MAGAAAHGAQGDAQQRSRLASQWKNLTWSGAQHFQVSFQVLQVMEPWKDAK